jgi:hypothetical protein
MIDRYTSASPLLLDAVGFHMADAVSEPHLNRVPFTGVLSRVDEPSTRPPNGAEGHRVLIPREVAERALPTLIGMGIDVESNFKDHAKTRKIGVITEAHLDGKDLVIAGHIYGKDFPEETTYIKKHKHLLGASYEIADVEVDDTTASIWRLNHFVFTGGAILRRDAAAYAKTSIAASQEEVLSADELFTISQFCEEFQDYLLIARAVVAVHLAHERRLHADR